MLEVEDIAQEPKLHTVNVLRLGLLTGWVQCLISTVKLHETTTRVEPAKILHTLWSGEA